jgi:hypothetical protein
MDEVLEWGRIGVCIAAFRKSSLVGTAPANAASTIWLVVAALFVTHEALAQSVNADPSNATAYRRILVPADSPAKWPTGNDRYLPVESRDFETWVEASNRPARSARIAEAIYRARFDGDQIVDGHAQWKIRLGDESSVILPLDGVSLVIDSAKWRDDPVRPAQIGWWSSGAGQPLVRALRVEHSGELELDWHTTKSRAAADQFECSLVLPEAAATRFALDVPEAKVPTLEGALLLSSERIASELPASAKDSTTPQTTPISWRRWTWAAKAATPLRFVVVDRRDSQPARPPSATYREDTHYQVTNEGLDTEVKVRCHAGNSELSELDLSLVPDSKIISVTVDDQPLSWHLAETADDAVTRATIKLPQTKMADDFTVVLKIWSPSIIHQMWPLPTVQVANAFWTSGSMTLELDENFTIEDVTTDCCIQSDVHLDDHENGGSSNLEFAVFSPTAHVELRMRQRLPSAHVRTVTSLEVGGRTINGRFAAQLHVDRGKLPTVCATLQPGWTVDAVETIPAEALDEWHVDARDHTHRLELMLNNSASDSNPVTIVVTGVRPLAEPLESLDRDALGPLHWQDIEVESNLLHLQTAGRYELEPSSELSMIAASDLSDEDRQLLADNTNGQLFDLSAAPSAAHLGLTPMAAIDDVDVEYEATLCGKELRQSYHILCRPRGSGIDQLLLYFSEPLNSVAKWEDAESHEPIRADRMPDSDPRLRGLPPGGELWTLRLRRIYDRPVSLVMELKSPLAERRPVPLLSSPDAASQTGRATIRSTNKAAPAIAVQGLSPAPLPEALGDGRNHTEMASDRAIYRYEPVHFYQAGAPPRLWIGPQATESGLPDVVASRAQIDSFYAADGTGVHRIACQIEKVSKRNLELKLPGGVDVRSIQLDSTPILSTDFVVDGENVQISLPESFARGQMKIELRSVGQPLSRCPKITAPFPAFEGTVLSGEWKISLPSEFAARGPGLEPSINSFDWKQRLFGPLIWLKRLALRGLQHLPTGLDEPDGQTDLTIPRPTSPAVSHEPTGIDPKGWRTFHATFAAALPEPIYVEDQSWVIATAVSAFLLSLFAAAMGRTSARTYILLTAIAAAAAICLPAAVAPLSTGVLWGLLFSPVCRRLLAPPDRSPMRESSDQAEHGHLIELAATAIVVLFITASGGVCAPPAIEGEVRETDTTIHPVLVPIDEKGQPVGSKVFVEEQLLRRLLDASAARKLTGGSWLFSNLKCTGNLARISGPQSGNAKRWAIDLDVETFAQDCNIALPLVMSQADWSEAASVDGIPSSINWNADGIGCTIVVREPGRHHLSIEFEPRLETTDGKCCLALKLPPLAGAGFQLNNSPLPAALTVEGGQMDRHDDPHDSRISGELDGSGQFAIAWIEGATGQTAVGGIHVEELSWLRIGRDRVELDFKILLRGAGAPDTVGIVADRCWELLSDGQDEPTPTIQQIAHSPRSIRVAVPPGGDEVHCVSLHFRLGNAVLPGQVRIPPVLVTSVPIASQRLVASIDSKWDCEASGGAVVLPGAAAVNDFIAMWGELDRETPQLAINTTDSRPGWFFVVRPRRVESKIEQQLAITAFPDSLKLRYEADVVPQGASRFCYSVLVPELLKVDRVTTTVDGQNATLEPVRVASNQINVFFTATMTNPFHLVLTGSVPAKSSAATPIPLVSALDPKSSRQIVQIFRDEETRVKVQDLEPVGQVESSVGETSDKTAHRFVGAYLIDPARTQDSQLLIERAETSPMTAATSAEGAQRAPGKSVQERSPRSIRLAETAVSIGPAGSWYAVTSFHISPCGIAQCVLQLPTAQSLVTVKVDDHDALIQSIDPQRSRVQLCQPNLPQTLNVVVRGTERLDPDAHIIDLARPSLWNLADEIPVEVGLWALDRPVSPALPVIVGSNQVSPLEAATLRLDRLTRIAESSTQATTEIPAVDAGNWLVPRIRELLAARQVVEILQVQASNMAATPALVHSEDDPTSLALASSQAWIDRAEELVSGPPISPDAATNASSPPLVTPSSEAPPRVQSANFVSQGDENRLAIKLVPVGITASETRASLLALIVGMAVIALWAVDRSHPGE